MNFLCMHWSDLNLRLVGIVAIYILIAPSGLLYSDVSE